MLDNNILYRLNDFVNLRQDKILVIHTGTTCVLSFDHQFPLPPWAGPHALPLGMAGRCLTAPFLFCPHPLQSSLWVVVDSHSPVMLILCLFIALLTFLLQ